MNAEIEKSITKLEKWIEDHDYKGYEPFDGLSSFLYPYAFKNLLAERILQQAIRQSPFNLRPLLGVKPLPSTKGRGYIASGYMKRFELTGNQIYKERAINCLKWLMENKSPFHSEYSWGNHFEYSSRGGRIPKYESTIVWISLIGQVFLDAYELYGDQIYLDVAISVCDWILKLSREKTKSGACISYVAYSQSSIHNSNMLGAAMLARAAKYHGDKKALDVSKEAMQYSCSGQLPDGA